MTRSACLLFMMLVLTIAFTASPAKAQAVTVLHSFGDGSVPNDGSQPEDLIQGSDGNFYGVTYGEGDSDATSTLFKMTPMGAITILYSLPDPFPQSFNNISLTQGIDGNLYGVSEFGGSTVSVDPHHNGYGFVFKLTFTRTFTTLHTFGDGSVANDGEYPSSSLVLGSDGNFYGTTGGGGSTGNGTVFKITPTGTETVFDFGNGSTRPTGLLQGTDGDFYGITTDNNGGTGGSIFKMTPSGVVTILHTLVYATDGNLMTTLVQGADGNFYGTNFEGGTYDSGTVFRITPDGTFTTLHNFSALGPDNINSDGAHLYGTLVQSQDGSLYGTTANGGSGGGGTIFKITPAGVLTTLVNFTDSNDGGGPQTALISAGNGIFYGTTIEGGTAQGGTAFIFNLAAVPLTLTSLSPTDADAGNPGFTLTITGTGFNDTTLVTFGGTVLPIVTLTATKLTVNIPASSIATVGTYTVIVNNPGIATLPFTVVYPWSARDVAAAPDGTARLLWGRADGAAGIWVMSANDSQTLSGPVYGPYTGWTAQDVTTASDGTSRILWNRYDGATGVWALDAHGNETSIGPTYGPFSGWKAIDLATAPNGISRLMWRYTNGQAGILTLNATGGEVTVGRNYGPYTGWTATAVGAAGDGTARILWTRSDGAMSVWSMDANDLQLSTGPTYGPYSDSHGTWRATDLSTSSDGTSQVLWKRSDGAIGVWSFSASNVQTLVGPVYGPYTGWMAAELDAANDKARVLCVRSDRVAGIWSFGPNDIESLIGPVYGPY